MEDVSEIIQIYSTFLLSFVAWWFVHLDFLLPTSTKLGIEI